MLPQYLYRNSDGERFTCQPNGEYTMDSSEMYHPHQYSYEILISYGFKEFLEDCEIIVSYIPAKYDGHGYPEDESC